MPRSDLACSGGEKKKNTVLSVSMATDSLQRCGKNDTCSLTFSVKHEVSAGAFIYHNNRDLYTALHNVRPPPEKRVRKITAVQFRSSESVLWCRPCEARLKQAGRKSVVCAEQRGRM